MSKALPQQLAVVDESYSTNRTGPRLEAYEHYLDTIEAGQAFEIPIIKSTKGKNIPQFGVNIKAINKLYAPKVFKKKRKINKSGAEVLRVFRVA